MEENKTTEFSFLLKQSGTGVGVFSAHAILAGTYLRLFGADDGSEGIFRDKREVPALFQGYVLDRPEGKVLAPRDFGQMHIGWYLNHSVSPSAEHKNLRWYAARDITEGEEILIDYNTLGDPDADRDAYY